MKMLYKYMSETVNIEDTGAILLVIEDKHLFRKTVLSVYHNNEDELFVFSENYKPLDFAKNIRFVDNILTFEFADKKLMTKVSASLENMCNENFFDEIMQLRESCNSLCSKLSKEYDFDFDFCDSIETSAFIKLFAFTPRNDSVNSTERLIRYLRLLANYLGIKCFILQNMHLYLSENEIDELLRTVSMHNICIVDIENSVPKCISKLEKLIIIDNDLCEIIDKEY